jgi:translation initiation factor 4G
MGKPSALLGTGPPKPMAEAPKALEPMKEVARPAPAAAAVAPAAPSAHLTKKSESLLKEYFSIVDLNKALLCV